MPLPTDEVVRVRSPRLVAYLIERGCRPIRRNTFAATATARRLIAEYVDTVDAGRANADVRRLVDAIRARARRQQK